MSEYKFFCDIPIGHGEITAASRLDMIKTFKVSSDEEALKKIKHFGPGKLFKELPLVEIPEKNELETK